MFDWLHEIDGSVLLWIQEHIRMEWLNDIVIFITRLGNPGITWMILLAILLLVKRTRNTGKCALLALVCSFVINNLILKNLVARQRPYEVVEGLQRLIEPQKDLSFPSGHAANSMVIAVVIFMMLPKKYSWTALVFAVAIALSRLYVGVHYPTDVFFGMFSGALIGYLVVRWYRKKTTVVTEG